VKAFSSASFRILWCSSLALAGAQFMERVVTGWLALAAGGGPLAVGIVFAARMLPSLLLGLPFGALADRVDRRRVLLGVAIAGISFSLLLAFLAGRGTPGLWQVAAISFFMGSLPVADTPARQALVVDTVGRAGAANAIALNSVASRLFGAVGAFASGVAILALGVSNAYLIVAAAYGVELGLVLFVRAPAAHRPAGARLSFRRQVGEAAELILQQPVVRTLVLAAMTCEIFAFSYQTVVPTFARDVLKAGPEGLGTLTASGAIGATVAVLLLAGVPGAVRREPLLAGVYVVYGVGLLALGTATTLSVATAAALLIGACGAAFDALQQTMIQLAVPEDQRGRAAGIWVFSIGTAPIGHLEIGALAASAGAQPALLVNGACVLVGALGLVVGAKEYRPGTRSPRSPARGSEEA
jgi:MFS family permease